MFEQQQYLQAMGIQSWELTHPDRLAGYQSVTQPLEAECRLLLVCDVFPEPDEIILFERVLKSFHVSVLHARHAYPHQLAQLDLSALEWIWFAGTESHVQTSAKRLQSPLLSEIAGNNQHRRDLWQQICAYGAPAS